MADIYPKYTLLDYDPTSTTLQVKHFMGYESKKKLTKLNGIEKEQVQQFLENLGFNYENELYRCKEIYHKEFKDSKKKNSSKKKQKKQDISIEQWEENYKKNKNQKKRQKRFQETQSTEVFKDNSFYQQSLKEPIEDNQQEISMNEAQTIDTSTNKQIKTLFQVEKVIQKQNKPTWQSNKTVFGDKVSVSDYYKMYKPQTDNLSQEIQEDQEMVNEEENVELEKSGEDYNERELKEIESYLEESDNEEAYPHLKKQLGSPFFQIPKKILGFKKKKNDNIIYYLCSWHQDYKTEFYTPSYVPSPILRSLQQQKLIKDFYEKQLPKSLDLQDN